MRKLKVVLRKEMVRDLPTWVTFCNHCGPVSRNWAYGPAKDVKAAHIRRHR